MESLQAEVERIAPSCGGVFGLCALSLEHPDRSVSLNGAEPFPMWVPTTPRRSTLLSKAAVGARASTFKVPLAVQLLRRVDAGEVSLDHMHELMPGDYSPGSGTLTSDFCYPGVSLSIRVLMERMLQISDNTATDVLLEYAGGGGAVTAYMRELGLDGINVSRPCLELIADWVGVSELPQQPATWEEANVGSAAFAPVTPRPHTLSVFVHIATAR